jgi:hypothetical protein
MRAAYLAYFQSATHKILMDLPQRRGEEHDKQCVRFLSLARGLC